MAAQPVRLTLMQMGHRADVKKKTIRVIAEQQDFSRLTAGQREADLIQNVGVSVRLSSLGIPADGRHVRKDHLRMTDAVFATLARQKRTR